MSYFPEDIPYMSKEELRENGIRIPKDATDTNVGDTISRQAAIDAMAELQGRASSKGELTGISKAWKRIKQLPSIQPEPKEGHWIEGGIYREVIECNCSECGQLMTTAATVRMNYCTNCGAYMKGERQK